MVQTLPIDGGSRRQGDGAPGCNRGGLELSQLEEGRTQDVMQQGVVGVNLQRRPTVIDGVLESLQSNERFAARFRRALVPRIPRQRGAVRFYRALQLAGPGQHVTQAVMESRGPGAESHALAVRLQGFVLAAQLAQRRAEVGPAGGRLGMAVQDGAVPVDRVLQPAVGMEPHGVQERAARVRRGRVAACVHRALRVSAHETRGCRAC